MKTLILLTRLKVLDLLEEMTMQNLYLAVLMIESDPQILLSQKISDIMVDATTELGCIPVA